jgi:hypothetical protein
VKDPRHCYYYLVRDALPWEVDGAFEGKALPLEQAPGSRTEEGQNLPRISESQLPSEVVKVTITV